MIAIPAVTAAAAQRPAPVAATPAAAASAATPAAADVDPRIAEAARGFEGVFMNILVEEMFTDSALTAGASGYSGLITQSFGDALADSGGVGLAAMLMRQFGGQP